MSDLRSLVLIGVFGALWGAVEFVAGAALQALRVPFAGAVLTAMGVTVLLIGRRFVPRRGSVLQMGLVTALLKMASWGGVVLFPLLAILIESLIVEVVVSLTGGTSRRSFLLASVGACLWPLVHPFFAQGILAGAGILTVWGWTVEKGAALLRLPGEAVWAIAGLLVVIHVGLGIAAGLLAWDATGAVQRRLAATPSLAGR